MTQTDLFDPTANRHSGNAESRAANVKNREIRSQQKTYVLEACRRFGGVTCRELAKDMKTGMNAISGRFSELKRAGLIRKVGVRDGCGVYSAI